MPSDEMVEKVARAIAGAYARRAWPHKPDAIDNWVNKSFRTFFDEARAALAAAEAGEAAVAHPLNTSAVASHETGNVRDKPVAWRVHDWADGWILFDNEARAKHEAENSTGVIQPLFASPPSEASKGACPVCGCEEVNSRRLWTCECPAPSEASRDERAAIRKEAFEEAARVAEDYAREREENAGLEETLEWQKAALVYAKHARRIATAIRARGETP